jgi:hypothetical protein
MKVTPRAVKDLARNSGFPEDVVQLYLDELINMTFAVTKRERKSCVQAVQKAAHTRMPMKALIAELTNERDYEDDLYDIA